jgi:co-chaperonin GroES (HSP10)
MIKPLGNLVLIKLIEEPKETKSSGGILLTGAIAEKNYDQGIVIDIAEGHDHRLINQTVIFGKGFGKTIEIDGEKVILITYNDIWGTL